MDDRLGDLGINDSSLYEADDLSIELPDSSSSTSNEYTTTPNDSEFIKDFYTEIAEVKGILLEIRNNTDELKKKYDDSFGEIMVIGDKVTRLKKKINSLRKSISSKLTEVRDRLKVVEKENKALKEKLGVAYRTAEYRIRENQYNSILKDFAACVNKFQEVELEYKKKKRHDIKRKLKIVNDKGEINEDDIDDFLKNPRPIFIEKLKGTSVWKTVQTEYEVAIETRDDLLELETSMNELVDMFRDMYGLVQMNQDLIDNIEHNVQDTIEYIEKGTKHVRNARKMSKKTKYCAICSGIWGTLFIIIAITVVLVVLAFVL